MSHAATNWALKQKGLKPATKIVLLCLADCHNPQHGCFPSQARSAGDALAAIEAAGFSTRRKSYRIEAAE